MSPSKIIVALIALGVLASSPQHLAAEIPASPPPQPLRVGICVAPPFVIKTASGDWEGLGFDLWRDMLKALNMKCEYHEYTKQAQLVTDLGSGQLDAGLGDFTPDTKLFNTIRFTLTYYYSGLGIAINRTSERSHWLAVLRVVGSKKFLLIVAFVFAVMVAFGLTTWRLERLHKEQHFGGNFWNGIGKGIWWAASTITTTGYGDIVPKTVLGRALALIGMLGGVVLISAFTATVSSLITASRMQSTINSTDDLRRLRVGTVTDSAGEDYLRDHYVRFRSFDTLEEALQCLDNNRLDLVIHDLPSLNYYINNNSYAEIDLLPNILRQVGQTFALAKNIPCQDALNAALLDQISCPQWSVTQKHYLGASNGL